MTDRPYIHPSLKRKAPIKRSAPKPSRGKVREAEQYRDSTNLAFSDVRGYMERHFGARAGDWPTVTRVDDPFVCSQMHLWHPLCWNCCSSGPMGGQPQAHHIIGGTKGRSDEFGNIAMLCGFCHPNANTAKLPMGRILFLKHRWDRQHLSWARLCLLARKYLPDLITD